MEDLEIDTNELADDVSLDDLHAPQPLSWSLSHVNDPVVHRGWEDKFNVRMAAQVGLSVFYAVAYGLTFVGLHAYYEWPPLDDDNNRWRTTIDIRSVLTDEEYFQCEDKSFYLNETGPVLNLDESRVSYENGFYNLLRYIGFVFGFTIFIFVAFAICRLYAGTYNQLLLLVKFKNEEQDDGTLILKPVKMSFAYTIMCNVKSFKNAALVDLCKSFLYAK